MLVNVCEGGTIGGEMLVIPALFFVWPICENRCKDPSLHNVHFFVFYFIVINKFGVTYQI